MSSFISQASLPKPPRKPFRFFKFPFLLATFACVVVLTLNHGVLAYEQNQAILQQRRHSSSMSGSGIAGHQDHGIQLEGKRKQVLEDTLALFSSKPSLEIFERSWREDATFEDPLSKCHSYPEYAPQWFSLPKLFPTSITKSYRVLSSTTNPNQITYHQEQEYTVRGIGAKKLMVSTVVIDLDDEDRIIHLSDKWNGKDHPSNFVAMALRRLNAKTLPWLVSVPKLKKGQ